MPFDIPALNAIFERAWKDARANFAKDGVLRPVLLGHGDKPGIMAVARVDNMSGPNVQLRDGVLWARGPWTEHTDEIRAYFAERGTIAAIQLGQLPSSDSPATTAFLAGGDSIATDPTSPEAIAGYLSCPSLHLTMMRYRHITRDDNGQTALADEDDRLVAAFHSWLASTLPAASALPTRLG